MDEEEDDGVMPTTKDEESDSPTSTEMDDSE